MRNTLHIRISVSVGLIASLFALAGCGHKDSEAAAPQSSPGAPATAPGRPAIPDSVRAIAASHAQGAGADGKRAAAAIAAATKH